MAKRYVEECDLCKKEAELNNSITIKPNKGKKTGRSYDICDTCKERMEKALISSEGIKVFGARVPIGKNEAPRNSEDGEVDEHVLELPDGTTRTIPTREEIQNGVDEAPGDFQQGLPEGTTQAGERCLHMNRTRPRVLDNTSKISVQCRDCGVILPYKSQRTRELELNVRAPQGTNLKDHPSEERVR